MRARKKCSCGLEGLKAIRRSAGAGRTREYLCEACYVAARAKAQAEDNARRAKARAEDNARWERIYREKFECADYYGMTIHQSSSFVGFAAQMEAMYS